MNFSDGMYYLIAFLSVINFIRIITLLVGSDLYDIRQLRRKRSVVPQPIGGVTVVIPAYNEEVGVIRTVESVLKSTYEDLQVIVVNDGSSDKTLAKLRAFQRRNRGKLTIVNQKNAGKAAAINRAIQYWAKKELVMVVDADSLLDAQAVENMVRYFYNPQTIAVAANVKIIPSRSLLGMAQRFEYLISYRMKRSLSMLGAEYIVGGVGSTFRRSVVLECGLYDTDTMTEDIDLTVKLIRRYGNKKGKIYYAANALAYTEHVMTFRSLVKQRFRWKYGRFQTFMKNKELFFSREKKHSKILTWYQLPHALFSEVVLLVEPLLVGFILAVVVLFSDFVSLLWVYTIVTTFVFLILLGEDSESRKEKILLTLCLPAVYGLMYVLTVVEFVALLQSIRQSKGLREKRQHGSWQHVERSGAPVTLPAK